MKEILNYAKDCLNCKVKPCSMKGCPIKTNIPEFINMVKEEKFEEAYKILQENNLSSYICSLVCPQEEQCEGSCVRGIKEVPVHIGNLEKAVNEWAIQNNFEYKIEQKESNGKKVAIVGAGPAGLACAIELLKEGFTVDIYEKDELPGGILIYGIPDFRLSKSIVEDLINKIKLLGATFITKKELGKDFSIDELTQKYNATFIGIGATKSTTYALSENDINGVYNSDEFLKAYNEKRFICNLGKVVVIGGGNVAMDSARAAIKMGAEEVKILYRRDRVHMPARECELDDAIQDGVKFKELVRVISADTEEGKIKNVNCIETEIIDGKAVDKNGAENYKEEANTVIFAIGLKPDKNLLQTQGIELDDWGYVKVDEDGKTNLDNVYAGGDNTESKATVCRALAAGKKAAFGIIKNI